MSLASFFSKVNQQQSSLLFFLPIPTLIFLAAPWSGLFGIFSQFEFQRKLPYYLVVLITESSEFWCTFSEEFLGLMEY